MGDRRLSKRLVTCAELTAKTMGKPVTATPECNTPAVKGFWRFLDRTDESGITPADYRTDTKFATEKLNNLKTILEKMLNWQPVDKAPFSGSHLWTLLNDHGGSLCDFV